MSEATATAQLPSRVTVGEVTLDRDAHLLTVRGRPVTLALLEFRLLDLLMSHADHVLRNAHILAEVWGPDFSGDPSTVAVHVLRLRRKLALDGAAGHVRTVRGLGYVFDTRPVA